MQHKAKMQDQSFSSFLLCDADCMIIRSETPHEIVTWFCYLDFDCHCCCASDARTVAEISDRGCAQKSRRQAKSRGSSAANCRWQAGSSGSPLVDLKISTFDQEAMRPEVVNPSRFVLIAKENGIRSIPRTTGRSRKRSKTWT